MTRCNPPSRTPGSMWRPLALAAAVGAAACGDSIATIERAAERAGPADEPGTAASSNSGNSTTHLDTASAQVVEGALGEPHLDPAAFVRGDSIVRDSVVVGHLRRESEGGSVAPFGVPPGHCLILIFYYLDTGEIIGFTILHCEPPDDDGGGGGGGGTPGTEPTDTTTVTIGLNCPSSVTRGARATCTLTKDPSNAAVTNVRWTFANTAVTTTKLNGESWGGSAVSTGTVKVTGSAGGHSFTLTRTITVQDRGWTWPVSLGWAPGTEVDACGWRPGSGGKVVRRDCGGPKWFDIRGFTVAQGSGPWARLYYVSGANAPLDLLADLHPRFRVDGPFHPLTRSPILSRLCKQRFGPSTNQVSTYQANTQCEVILDYQRAIQHVRAHEDRHLRAAASASRANDLYAMWDAVVETSRAGASRAASTVAKNVQDQVDNAMRATHTGGSVIYTFWIFHTSGGWQKAGVRVHN